MEKIMSSMLSTKDNPFNPFEDFDNWYNYDSDKGYNSCGILARITGDTDNLAPNEEAFLVENAIDSFIKSDPLHLYIKVQKEEDVWYFK